MVRLPDSFTMLQVMSEWSGRALLSPVTSHTLEQAGGEEEEGGCMGMTPGMMMMQNMMQGMAVTPKMSWTLAFALDSLLY